MPQIKYINITPNTYLLSLYYFQMQILYCTDDFMEGFEVLLTCRGSAAVIPGGGRWWLAVAGGRLWDTDIYSSFCHSEIYLKLFYSN